MAIATMTLLRLLVAVAFLVIPSLAEVKVSIDLRTVEPDLLMLGLYYNDLNGGNLRATAYMDFGKKVSVQVNYEEKDGAKTLKFSNKISSLQYDTRDGTEKGNHLFSEYPQKINLVTATLLNPVIFYDITQRSFTAHDTTSGKSVILNSKHENTVRFIGTYIERKEKPYVVIKYWENFQEAIGDFVANQTIDEMCHSVLLSSDDDSSYLAFYAWELPVSYTIQQFVPGRPFLRLPNESQHITRYIEADYVTSPEGNTLFFNKYSSRWKRRDDRAERVSFARNNVLGVRDPSYDRTRWLTSDDLQKNFKATLLLGHDFLSWELVSLVETVARVNINTVEDVKGGYPFYAKGHILWLTEGSFDPRPEFSGIDDFRPTGLESEPRREVLQGKSLAGFQKIIMESVPKNLKELVGVTVKSDVPGGYLADRLVVSEIETAIFLFDKLDRPYYVLSLTVPH